jgi:hypothetical protein
VEFLEAAPDAARSIRFLRDGLLLGWEHWPLRERGTAAEWAHFMRLLGVTDGLVAIRHKTISRSVADWAQFCSSDAAPLSIESTIGGYWRRALRIETPGFRYVSGNYETGETLYALPGQAEHAVMSDRAKSAYGRLVIAALADMPPKFLNTTLFAHFRLQRLGDPPQPARGLPAASRMAPGRRRGGGQVATAIRLLVRAPIRTAPEVHRADRPGRSRRARRLGAGA